MASEIAFCKTREQSNIIALQPMAHPLTITSIYIYLGMQEVVRPLNLQAFIIYQGEEEEIFCMTKQGMLVQQQASQAGWFFPFFLFYLFFGFG
jgi:hypothetical protein